MTWQAQLSEIVEHDRQAKFREWLRSLDNKESWATIPPQSVFGVMRSYYDYFCREVYLK